MLDRDQQNTTTKNYTFWGNCCICGEHGHSTKECQTNSTMENQDQTCKGQTHIQTAETISHPSTMSPARPTVLTQQITTDFLKLVGILWNRTSG